MLSRCDPYTRRVTLYGDFDDLAEALAHLDRQDLLDKLREYTDRMRDQTEQLMRAQEDAAYHRQKTQ